MKRFFFLFLLFPLAVSATKTPLLRAGEWRGVLQLNDSTQLPFSFTVGLAKIQLQVSYILTVHNAEERIPVEALAVTKDSVNWHMPVFDSYFKCTRESDSAFSGTFYNNAASHPYGIAFHAVFGQPRFPYDHSGEGGFQKVSYMEGKWETTFSPGTADSSKAIGMFSEKKGFAVTGTFATETGDYRYLEGAELSNGEYAFSCFDGSHAFLFTAKYQPDGTLKGDFWSGNYWHEPWTAKRNDNFQLRDPEKLTWIIDSTKVNFTFNDLNGHPVSLSDPQFKGKVVIVQIMGSWCPNCMDETKWLSGVYEKYHAQGLEIISLAYERSSDTAIANPNIRRVKNRFDAQYTFLNTRKSGSKAASESLPFLNGIMSFPTTIYIDRSGNVRRIFTGFNGPATGAYYQKDTEEALRFIQQLLAEKAK